MTSKVIFRTFVFRGGKVLCQAAESLLKQTYSNFDWYILDVSGNEQNRKLLSKYNDNRIIYVDLSSYLARSDILPSTFLKEIFDNYSDGDYFAVLDADDTYTPDFAEKMLNYMELNNLDIAACGSNFIDARSGKIYGVRKLEQNLILETPADFSKYFTEYYQFIRTVWGKMFKLSCLRKCDFGEKKQVYGNDTLFTMEAFRNAERVGILAESLHKYHISSESVTHRYDPIRISSDSILYDAALKYLRAKCGEVSIINEDFLFVLYLNAIRDTLNVLLNANMPVSEKLSGIHEIFTCEVTRNLANRPYLGHLIGLDHSEHRRKLFDSVAKWMLLQDKTRSEEGLAFAVDVLAVMRICPFEIPGWSYNEKINLLLALRKKMSGKCVTSCAVDMRIKSLLATSPLLKSLPVEHVEFLKSVVVSVLSDDFQSAIDALFVLAGGGEIPDEYAESYITLGQNVCAAAEYADGWIFFRKLWIDFLYERLRLDEARAELNELLELLPDDEDLQALRERL